MEIEIIASPRPQDCEFSLLDEDKFVTEESKVSYTCVRKVRPTPYQNLRNAQHELDEQIAKMEQRLTSYLLALVKNGIPKCIKKNKNYAVFFKALCEYILTNLSDSKSLIIKMVNFLVNNRRSSIVPSCAENITEWTARRLNINWVHAALAIGHILGLKPENCFARFPLGEKNNESTPSDTNFSVRIPKNLCSDQSIFHLEDTYPIKNISGMVLQTVCLYSCNGEKITVYANASGNIGTSVIPALLPGANLIDRSTDAIIHLCLCPDVLWSYLTHALEGKIFERENIVVTGCFGGVDDVKPLDVSCVCYHPVVLICSPDRAEWSSVEEIAKKCQDQGASSVCKIGRAHV